MELILLVVIVVLIFGIWGILGEVCDGVFAILLILVCLGIIIISGYGIYKLQSQEYETRTHDPVITNRDGNYVFYKPLVIKKVEKYKPWSTTREYTIYVEEPK